MVRIYTNTELINRVKSLKTFNGRLPRQLLIGVRSARDTTNVFDDKMYLFIDGQYVLVTLCTTNPGGPTLLGGWKKYNKQGAAVLMSDVIYYDTYLKSNGKNVPHHNGKMPCLRQVKNMLYYRDNNNDGKSDEIGQVYEGNYATNIHFNSYNIWNKIKTQFIGEWSAGCQVINDSDYYNRILSLIDDDYVSYCLLKEF